MKPYLLILMRNDLDSMSAGRAAAMASHATSAFTVRAEQAVFNPLQVNDIDVKYQIMDVPGQTYVDWRSETPQFFGTAIVVGVTGAELKYYHEMAKAFGYMTEVINDPTYAVRDGSVTHLVPLDTCGYVFVNKDTMFLTWSKKLPLF